MAGGERRSTEDDRHAGFMRGLQAVDALKRDEHEFKPGAPARPPPIARLAPPEPEADEPSVEYEAYETNDAIPLILGESPGRLDEIATLMRTLTYGEMIELSAELWQARPPMMDTDSAKKLDGIIEAELPSIWHRWSNERSNNNGG
jgi:hypothetical protein